MKRLISHCMVLVVLIALTTACSKQADYTHLIPADATAVVAFNLESLIKKSGVNDKENKEIKEKTIEALKSGMNAATYQQLENVLNKPSESGIDLGAPVYLFSSPNASYSTLLLKISNEEKMMKYIDLLVREQVCQPVVEAEGYSYATINQFGLLAFNPTALVFIDVTGTTRTEEAKKLLATSFQQTAENSINSHGGFNLMTKQKGDISFLASNRAIPNAYAEQANLMLPEGVTLDDLQIVGKLDFEKGKITSQFEYYTANKEILASIERSQRMFTKVNNNFAKLFPASTLALLNVGINGKEFYELLLENKKFINNVSIAQADEVKKLFSSLNGDVTLGLLNVTMKQDATSLLMYADVANSDALKTIYENQAALKLGKGEELAQLGENEYVYKKNKGANLFFGVRGKQFYATNDELIYKEIGKTIDPSLKDTKYASDMNSKCMFAAINIEAILDLPIVKLINGIGGGQIPLYYQAASELAYFDMSMDNKNRTELNLVFQNKDVNALKQLLNFARQFAGM